MVVADRLGLRRGEAHCLEAADRAINDLPEARLRGRLGAPQQDFEAVLFDRSVETTGDGNFCISQALSEVGTNLRRDKGGASRPYLAQPIPLYADTRSMLGDA